MLYIEGSNEFPLLPASYEARSLIGSYGVCDLNLLLDSDMGKLDELP